MAMGMVWMYLTRRMGLPRVSRRVRIVDVSRRVAERVVHVEHMGYGTEEKERAKAYTSKFHNC